MAEFKILKTWELETSINQILHQQAANHYSRLNMFFMIPIIVLSSALGTIGFIATGSRGYDECGDNFLIHILMGCFGYVSAILTTTHNFLNIQKLQATHSLHAVEYSKISRDIKMHIYLSETDVKVYANIAEYIKQCRTKIDKLIESADDIPEFIEKRVSYKVDDIRSNESKEINELIQLSKKNEEDIQGKPLNINDMTDLSEILVVKERRKSRDGLRYSSSGTDSPQQNRQSDDSDQSKESTESKDSAESKNNSESSSDNSDKLQERLSLDTFFRSVKDKSARTSWKRHLKLLDDVDNA
jgi:hypothetical protein